MIRKGEIMGTRDYTIGNCDTHVTIDSTREPRWTDQFVEGQIVFFENDVYIVKEVFDDKLIIVDSDYCLIIGENDGIKPATKNGRPAMARKSIFGNYKFET
jgi:hypothetical protein